MKRHILAGLTIKSLIFSIIFFDSLEPTYDPTNTWQATVDDIDGTAVRSHITTTSYSTQHYAFFGGEDNDGAIGIAYVATACLRQSSCK